MSQNFLKLTQSLVWLSSYHEGNAGLCRYTDTYTIYDIELIFVQINAQYKSVKL